MAWAQAVYCMPGFHLLPCHLHDSLHFSCAKLQGKEEEDTPTGGGGLNWLLQLKWTDSIILENHLQYFTILINTWVMTPSHFPLTGSPVLWTMAPQDATACNDENKFLYALETVVSAEWKENFLSFLLSITKCKPFLTPFLSDRASAHSLFKWVAAHIDSMTAANPMIWTVSTLEPDR